MNDRKTIPEESIENSNLLYRVDIVKLSLTMKELAKETTPNHLMYYKNHKEIDELLKNYVNNNEFVECKDYRSQSKYTKTNKFDFMIEQNIELLAIEKAVICEHKEILLFLESYTSKLIDYIYKQENNLKTALDNCVCHSQMNMFNYLMETFPYQKYNMNNYILTSNIEWVDFILSHPEYSQHIDVEKFFIVANDYRIEEVLDYLIYEHKIKETIKVIEAIDGIPHLQEKFEKRNFNEQLNNGLVNKDKVNVMRKKV